MPTYPYTCLDCHKRFEVFMSYSEYGTKTVHCKHCNSENVQRRIGRIRIAKSERIARLAFVGHRPFYEILRTKLNWGGIPKDR